MEYVGKARHEIHTTLHTADSFGNSKNTKITVDPSIEDGYHIYKCNWSKEAIEFYIDERMVYCFQKPKMK